MWKPKRRTVLGRRHGPCIPQRRKGSPCSNSAAWTLRLPRIRWFGPSLHRLGQDAALMHAFKDRCRCVPRHPGKHSSHDGAATRKGCHNPKTCIQTVRGHCKKPWKENTRLASCIRQGGRTIRPGLRCSGRDSFKTRKQDPVFLFTP